MRKDEKDDEPKSSHISKVTAFANEDCLEIPAHIISEIFWYTDRCEDEISGLGLVNDWWDREMECRRYSVSEIFVPQQKVQPGFTEILDGEQAKLLATLPEKKAKKLKFWWHSHVNMATFWSTTDVDCMNGFNTGDYNFSLVVNKRRDMLCRTTIFKPFLTYIDNLPINIDTSQIPDRILREQLMLKYYTSGHSKMNIALIEDEGLIRKPLAELEETFKANVKKKTYVYQSQGGCNYDWRDAKGAVYWEKDKNGVQTWVSYSAVANKQIKAPKTTPKFLGQYVFLNGKKPKVILNSEILQAEQLLKHDYATQIFRTILKCVSDVNVLTIALNQCLQENDLGLIMEQIPNRPVCKTKKFEKDYTMFINDMEKQAKGDIDLIEYLENWETVWLKKLPAVTKFKDNKREKTYNSENSKWMKHRWGKDFLDIKIPLTMENYLKSEAILTRLVELNGSPLGIATDLIHVVRFNVNLIDEKQEKMGFQGHMID